MKSREKYDRFDTADYLLTESDMVDYLQACFESGDPAVIIQALAAVARARNQTQLARDAGLTRQGLYKALSTAGNPSFETVFAIAKSLGFTLSFSNHSKPAAPVRKTKKVA
jgi:probable addiction module antidote protein